MKRFEYLDATSVEEAVSALAERGGKVLAGGTDLLGTLKGNILPEYPGLLVNIKNIPGLDFITEEEGVLRIGALATLTQIAESVAVRERYGALATAAAKTASLLLRNVGTIAGNICQSNRCWYYWASDNYFHCARKRGGSKCFAPAGESQYHSIFGLVNRCAAVNPSDTAPALVVLDAEVVTTKRRLKAEDFFSVDCESSTVLAADELVTEIRIPVFSGKSSFIKFAPRKTIDFATVSCAAAVTGGSFRICLNAVCGVPMRVVAAEEAMFGKEIDETNAETAGQAAVAGARPLKQNRYKVNIAKEMVKRAVLGCA
ncbi:MAG: FAD binding domain-containing protein [Clostridiales Family XIII bacterium]|jgi:xanthine dehydrogenase YagS FAD-binding subunit|nr:FAD binding domain-containing protein [Clostridiales Family XIII bacterium]